MTRFYFTEQGRISLRRQHPLSSEINKSLLDGAIFTVTEPNDFGHQKPTSYSLRMDWTGNVFREQAGVVENKFRGPVHAFLTLSHSRTNREANAWKESSNAYRLREIGKDFLSAIDLLEKWFPGIKQLRGCSQDPSEHAEGDVLVHTGKVFEEAQKLVTKDWSEREELLLLAAAICHDIEKPASREVRDGRVTFYDHANRAAERCPEFARRLGFNTVEAEALRWLVGRHQDAHSMNLDPAYRLRNYRHPFFKVLVALQQADAQASWRNADGTEHAPVLREFLENDSKELLARAAWTKQLLEAWLGISKQLTAADLSPGKLFDLGMRAALEWVGEQPIEEIGREAIGFALGFAIGRATLRGE